MVRLSTVGCFSFYRKKLKSKKAYFGFIKKRLSMKSSVFLFFCLVLTTTVIFAFMTKNNRSTSSIYGISNQHISMQDSTQPQAEKDTTPKVTGIGGIFFFSDDPAKTKEWYSKHLGMNTDQWGTMFESRNVDNPEQKEYLQWSPFKTGSDYFAPTKKEYMINYRVQNIEALVEQLRAQGVTIVDEIATYEYGKFIHIMDPDGNKLELWEPA
jgi:predicted enzyme related to lactoylglutathione lyase